MTDNRPRSAEPANLPLHPTGFPIPVAFLVAPGAELMDVAGPWGVFEQARTPDADDPAFDLQIVAESGLPVVLSGGLTVVPGHTLDTAPQPKVLVVPAMDDDGVTPRLLDWIRRMHAATDLTMSVCNGAFVLGQAGLLDGKAATCHHNAYGLLYAHFPGVTVIRGVRYVEDGPIATSGGLTCGIDLALRVVHRYLGATAAERASLDLEYHGTGWRDPTGNRAFAVRPAPTPDRPIDPVCEFAVDPATALVETWGHSTVHFCGQWCRDVFLDSPNRFLR